MLTLSQLNFLQRFFLLARLRVGILSGSSPALDDQLRIGGPFSVRGFDQGSIDMNLNPDVGGCLLAAESGITLGYRIAHLLSCHLFFDSGVLSNQKPANTLILYSFGAGVSIKLNPQSRIEINIAFPIENGYIRQSSTQIGIGTELL